MTSDERINEAAKKFTINALGFPHDDFRFRIISKEEIPYIDRSLQSLLSTVRAEARKEALDDVCKLVKKAGFDETDWDFDNGGDYEVTFNSQLIRSLANKASGDAGSEEPKEGGK